MMSIHDIEPCTEQISCPMCGDEDSGVPLGTLGPTSYARCQCCGWIFHIEE